MAIREPVYHQIVHGKWDDMMEIEKRWFAIVQEIGGFPMKRRHNQLLVVTACRYIWERDWDSLTQMEAAYQSYQKFTGNASDPIEWTEACTADRRSDVCRAIE